MSKPNWSLIDTRFLAVFASLVVSFFILFIFFFVLLVNQIPFDNFFVQYFLYPMSIGSNRVEGLTFSLKEFIGQFKYIYVCLLPLLAILLKVILKNKKKLTKQKDFIMIFTIVGMVLIFIYTQLLTKNQILIFFTIPLITAFSQIYFIKYFKKKLIVEKKVINFKTF